MQTLNTETTSVIATLACVQAAMETTPGRRCWCKDRQGRYQWANALFAEDACRTIPELIGATTAEIWPDDWREFERVGALVMETRRSFFDHPETLTPPSGGVFSALVSRSPMIDESGEVCGIIGYYDDGQCEAHRRAEAQLLLSFVPIEDRGRLNDGLTVLWQEFTS